MTGEKNKFTTTEKLWKLDDETLSTPKHDEMVLWLLEKQNIIKILPSIDNFLNNNNWWSSLISNNLIASFMPKIPDFWYKLKSSKELSDSDVNTVLENLKNQNSIKVKVEEITEVWASLVEQYIQAKNYMESHFRDLKIMSEVPIITHNKFIVGYWDIVINLEQIIYRTTDFYFWRGEEKDRSYDFRNDTIFIEVKPTIKSFGATLRQLKTYIQYLPFNNKNDVYLFTTDTQFKNAFKTQGIKVLNFPQDNEKVKITSI